MRISTGVRKGFLSGSNTTEGHKTPGEEQVIARTMGISRGKNKRHVENLSYQQQGDRRNDKVRAGSQRSNPAEKDMGWEGG